MAAIGQVHHTPAGSSSSTADAEDTGIRATAEAPVGLHELSAERSCELIAELSGDNRLTWASRRATLLLGVHPNELRGRPVLELTHSEDREAFVAALARTRLEEDGEEVRVRARQRHADGSWICFDMVLAAASTTACRFSPRAQGDQIPIEARIVAAADTYNAIISRRV